MEKLSPSLKTFDSLFERTCTELSKALCYYYPIEGDNDISEATTMMYWGCALRDAGYFIYPQIQYGGNISQHMEMAAINPDSKTIMIVEAKRLYSSEKAKSLGDDWVRLQNLKLPSEWDPIPEGLCSWACLIGTVWSEKNQHREWWMCGNREAAPQGVRKKSDWKKAVVRLAPGENIEFFEGM